MRLLFIIDPPSRLKPRKDSTVAMMRAAARAGDDVYIAESADWRLDGEGARTAAKRLRLSADDAQWYQVEEQGCFAPDFFDAIWMRKEPPVDAAFATLTLLLDCAVATGTAVYNAPRALREWNEKLAILRFPQHIPPTVVSADRRVLADFHAARGGAVLKPLDGMGGRGIYVSPAGDKNLSSVIDLIGNGGRDMMMAQAYLAAAQEGDSRVFVIGGKPAPWMLTRYPPNNDYRGNMAVGAKPTAQPLSAAARRIAEDIGPAVAAAGIVFAGLDVIGGRLTEINITCPTGLREVRDQTGDDLAETILTATRG